MFGAFVVFDRSDIFVDLAPSNSTSHSHIRNQFAVGGVIRQVIIGTCTEFCNRRYHISANGWGALAPSSHIYAGVVCVCQECRSQSMQL